MRENRCGWKTATTRPGAERAGGGDRRAQLGRVVGVVVDDERARARRRPEPLEAPPGAGEVRQRAGDLARPRAGDDARRQRGGGVGDVVRAGHRQRDRLPGPDEARAVRAQLDLRGAEERRLVDPDAIEERLGVRRVGDDAAQPVAQELRERQLELGVRGVRRVVVELDVRDDRDLRRELEERAVGLVGLDDEPLAGARRRRSSRGRSPPAGAARRR